MRNHSLFQMVTYPGQRLAAITVVEVPDPSAHGGVDLIHHPFKRHDCPLSLRQVSNPVFDLLAGFLRGLHMGIISPCFPSFTHPDREPEKAKLPIERVDDLRLGRIQGEFQPRQYLPEHVHYPGRVVSSAEQDNVVGIPDDTGAQSLLEVMPFPNPVQQMQVEIGQQR